MISNPVTTDNHKLSYNNIKYLGSTALSKLLGSGLVLFGPACSLVSGMAVCSSPGGVFVGRSATCLR